MPTLDQWCEWRQQCAAARCQTSTREALRLFGWQRFKHYATACGGPSFPAGALPDAEGCWNLAETRLATGQSRQGKRYKDWLFDRAGGGSATQDAVQGGASLLIRDVARDFLRREAPRPRHVSLDAPVGEGSQHPSLSELLPGTPDAAVEHRDFARRAGEIARSFAFRLTEQDRLVLLARELGVPLYHPAVELAAGVRKSRVALIWQGVFKRLAEHVNECLSGEDHPARLAICLLAAAELGKQILVWGKVEKSAAALFKVVERADARV